MTVYFLEATCCRAIKIGYTSGPVEDRIRQLQTAHPAPLRLLGCVEGDDDGSLALEGHLHITLGAWRLTGEWFRASPEVLACLARHAPEPDLFILDRHGRVAIELHKRAPDGESVLGRILEAGEETKRLLHEHFAHLRVAPDKCEFFIAPELMHYVARLHPSAHAQVSL